MTSSIGERILTRYSQAAPAPTLEKGEAIEGMDASGGGNKITGKSKQDARSVPEHTLTHYSDSGKGHEITEDKTAK
jgi:hypothetical protein